MLGVGEQDHEPFTLAVGEQVFAGVQGRPGPVQRVTGQAAVAVQLLLDPAPALVQGVTCEPEDMKRALHR